MGESIATTCHGLKGASIQSGSPPEIQLLDFLYGEWGDPAVAFVLSLVAAIIGAYSQPALSMLSVTVGVIAVGIVRDRQTRESLLAEMASLKQSLVDIRDAMQKTATLDAETVLRDRQAKRGLSDAKSPQELWACGHSLLPLIRDNQSILVRLLESGCSIRLMLLDPNSDITKWLDPLDTPTPGELIADIKSSLGRLRSLVESKSQRGSLEVHLLKTIPSVAMLIVDRNKPSGWVQVDIYPSFYNVPLDVSKPQLVFNKPDGRWYQFFCEQFEMMWNSPTYSVPHKLSQT